MCSQNHARHHRGPHHRFDHHRHPKCIQMSQDMWVRSCFCLLLFFRVFSMGVGYISFHFAIILLYFRHFPVIRHFPSFLVLFVCALCFPEVLQLRFCFSSISGHFWRVSVFPGGIMLLVPFSLVFWVVTSSFFLCQKQRHVRKHVANENNIIKDIIKYLNNITNIITNNMANNITNNSKPPATTDEEQYNKQQDTTTGLELLGGRVPPAPPPRHPAPAAPTTASKTTTATRRRNKNHPKPTQAKSQHFYIL